MTIEECPPRSHSALFEDHWDMGDGGLFRDGKFRIIYRASQSTTPLSHSTTPPRTITTHGTWQANGPKPKTQYVYSMTFDLDKEGHPIWSSAKVTGR